MKMSSWWNSRVALHEVQKKAVKNGGMFFKYQMNFTAISHRWLQISLAASRSLHSVRLQSESICGQSVDPQALCLSAGLPVLGGHHRSPQVLAHSPPPAHSEHRGTVVLFCCFPAPNSVTLFGMPGCITRYCGCDHLWSGFCTPGWWWRYINTSCNCTDSGLWTHFLTLVLEVVPVLVLSLSRHKCDVRNSLPGSGQVKACLELMGRFRGGINWAFLNMNVSGLAAWCVCWREVSVSGGTWWN